MLSSAARDTGDGPIHFCTFKGEFAFLSNMALTPFRDEVGRGFLSAAEYVAYGKAIFLQDPTAYSILGLSDQTWIQDCERSITDHRANRGDGMTRDEYKKLMYNAVYLKFTKPQAIFDGPDLTERLLATGMRELVYCEEAPFHVDKYLGVGFDRQSAAANREHWGANILGEVLELVRARIRDGAEEYVDFHLENHHYTPVIRENNGYAEVTEENEGNNVGITLGNDQEGEESNAVTDEGSSGAFLDWAAIAPLQMRARLQLLQEEQSRIDNS